MALENLTSQEQVPLQSLLCPGGMLCLIGFAWVIFCNGFSLLPLATAVLLLETLAKSHELSFYRVNGATHVDKDSSPDSFFGVIQEIPPLSLNATRHFYHFSPRPLSSSAQDFLCCFAKVLGWREAVQSVNGSVIMTIASSFGISAALTQTGAVISALHWMFFLQLQKPFTIHALKNHSRTLRAPFFIRKRLTSSWVHQTPWKRADTSNHQSSLQTIRKTRCDRLSIQINEIRRML